MRGLRSHFRGGRTSSGRTSAKNDHCHGQSVQHQIDERRRWHPANLLACLQHFGQSRWESNSWQGNILATRRRRKPVTKLLPSAEDPGSHRRDRVQRFQDGRGEALQRGRELESHVRGLIAEREGATCISGAQHRIRGLRG